MNTTIHEIAADIDVAPDRTRREPVRRVVAGSLAAGLVAALALTLGVFGGATEPVVTGAGLLGFGAGWALLALLSRRLTSQPQTWARVPAIVMTTVGLVLLVAQPGDRVLDAAGWVWPVPMLALTMWMVVELRRSLAGRVRWMVYPVLGALGLASVGGAFETISRARDRHDYPAPGALYDVGGHRLHLDCVGSGSPTVVLENGLGGMSAMWTPIASVVGATTRVCAYDRAGQGWSDDVGSPQDGLEVADDLHALLQRAGEQGPFVLVGHSSGGAYSMVYASRYPDDVAGMVLLDSMSPHQFTAIPSFEGEYQLMRRGAALVPSLARLGLVRPLPASMLSNLPEPQASQVKAYTASARGFRSTRDEQSTYPTMLEQAQALTSLGPKPLVVLTAAEQQRSTPGWAAAQDRLVGLSTCGEHRVVDTTHEGVIDDPTAYEASITAIVDVVRAVRADRTASVDVTFDDVVCRRM
jgi:pimeloyl-ACP methyl ester carboxylesterase